MRPLYFRSTAEKASLAPSFLAWLLAAMIAFPLLSTAQSSQPANTKKAKTTKVVSTKSSSSKAATAPRPASKEEEVAEAQSRSGKAGWKQHSVAGVESRNEGYDGKGDPTTAALEAYQQRAYPAAYVPMELSRKAQKAWGLIKASSQSKPAGGSWSLVGPSEANFPDVLTFAGQPYTTSGRITALAIDPGCNIEVCRLWVGAAGGGIWRTDNAMSDTPTWTFISGSFSTNAIGALTYDAASETLYAGTGEANASADSAAGFGIYKSTDGGDTWTQLAAQTSVAAGFVDCRAVLGSGPSGPWIAPAYNGAAFDGRSISSIVIDGRTMYVGSTRGIRGISSVSSGGAVSLAPGLPPYGLYKSTDGGATFTLLKPETVCLNNTLPPNAGVIQSSFGSTRGVNHIELDPTDHHIVYAAAFPRNNALPLNTGGGIWRSSDSGNTWTQIKAALDPTKNTDRAEFAVTRLDNGKTRMYVGEGASGTPNAKFYRSDDVASGSPTFSDLTTAQNTAYCTSQCWYDNFVISPAGHPDMVYLGGSYDYSTYGAQTNGRGVLLSNDAGVSFTDMTWDATTNPTPPNTCCQRNAVSPNGMHPDQHALVVVPNNPGLFFEGSDGGLVRSSGQFADISSQCTQYRGLSGADLTLCQQLLKQVPTLLTGINKGLSTLQFQSLSVASDDPTHLQGGTQDNGTFEHQTDTVWPQVIYGDGGQSGFKVDNSSWRFNTFTGKASDVNFQNGDPLKWVIATGPISASNEGAQFYPPIIADPNTSRAGTIFQGSASVWRTQDWAGDQTYLELNCPEFTTAGNNPNCGDFVQIGPAGKTSLTASNSGDYRGTTRSGGNVANIARTAADTSTLWAATTAGRVFVSKNADAAAGSVTYKRIDNLPSATASPGRFVSGIFIDAANPNHAWITYSSYSAITPSTPGHVFSVTYDPNGNGGTGDATWKSLDGSGSTAFPDFPATGIARDTNGDLYVSNDWGVLLKANGSPDWVVAGSGLPMVETAGLTIVPGARKLYAATHGRGAWVLTLP